MKKISTLLLALILLSSSQAQKQKLELNLSKGGIYSQKMTSNMSINQVVNGQQVKLDMTINGKMTYRVTDIQNAIYDLEVRYENLSMKVSMANGVMEFSSEKNDGQDIFSTILGEMINKPFNVKMTKYGKVNEVKNIEPLFSNMIDKFPEISEVQREQIKTQLTQAYGEKAFKSNLELSSAIFPDYPVSKGDKWTITTQLESGMAGQIETTYELKETGDSYFLIQGTSKITTADKDAYIEANGMPLRYDLTGTMTSDIRISKESGWLMDARMSQTIKGTAYIKDNPDMPGGMTIPLTMSNEMIMTEK